jgi:glycosyltransferase involved in cell wall biosynthesis
MKVSVIVPVFNGAAYLRETIDSVLGQTRAVDEIVVVDDGSTDSSPEILASYGARLTVLRQENRGVAAARNVGLEIASGDLITFLDQDDLWPADRTEAMVEALATHPDVDVVAGTVAILYQRQEPAALAGIDVSTKERETLLGSLMIRARVFRALGSLNIDVGYCDDTDFHVRRREMGTKTLYLDKLSLVYRLHEKNTSLSRDLSNHHFLAVLRESLRRRRDIKNEITRDDPGH